MCRDNAGKNWFVWCRWGRVGEVGATAELGPFSALEDASTAFCKKFKDKTGNKWEVLHGNRGHRHLQTLVAFFLLFD